MQNPNQKLNSPALFVPASEAILAGGVLRKYTTRIKVNLLSHKILINYNKRSEPGQNK